MKLSKKHIQMIFASYPSKCWIERSLINHHLRIYRQIFAQTDFLDKLGETPTFFERLFCIENGLTERPECCHCHKSKVKFNNKKYEYHKWCSAKCQASDPKCVSESRATRKKRYGIENYNGIEKSRQTRQAHNNGHWHSADFGDKVKSHKIANGHAENWVNSEKAKETITKLIAENPNFWKDRENKTKQTKLSQGKDANWNNREKFKETLANFTQEQKEHRSKALSLAYTSKTDEEKRAIREKTEKSCIEEYGFYPASVNPDIRKKIVQSCFEHNGVSCGLLLPKCRDANKKARIRTTYDYLMQNEFDRPAFDVNTLSSYCDRRFYEYEFTCLSCGSTFTSYIGSNNGIHKKCPICFPDPPHGTSHAEHELCEFLKNETDFQIITRTRQYIKPYELDIVIPFKNIAIEYDGLFWHCEDAPGEQHDRNYHKMKTEMCEAANIKLIHVFEDEWVWKKEIVKSRIMDILGKYSKTVFARKCDIREIMQCESSEFLNANHIQGNVNSSIRIGLYHSNELIALMTFGKCRFDKKHEWEMLRFCTKTGYHIPGAAGRLLKYFERKYKPKSLVSYADRRWSQGKLYERLGFKLDHISQPDYWYFDSLQHRYSRIMFQKHKLPKILKKFDPKKSEVENMKMNGWKRIFDCGNLVFIKTY